MEENESNNDNNTHVHPAKVSVLEASLACIQALSKANVEEEVRLQILGKMLEGLSSVHVLGCLSSLPMEEAENVEDNDSRLQCSQSKLSVLSNAMKRLDFLAQSVLNEEEQLKLWEKFSDTWSPAPFGKQKVHGLSEKPEIRERERSEASHDVRGREGNDFPMAMLLSFLGKAVERGELELKDFSSVLKCFHEAPYGKETKNKKGTQSVFAASSEMMNEKLNNEGNEATMEKTPGNSCKRSFSEEGNHLQGTEGFCPSVHNNVGHYPTVSRCFYPTDNNALAAPKAVTVAWSENEDYLFQELKKESVKGTSHVTQGSLENAKDKNGQVTRSFADILKKNQILPPLSYVQAAKKCMGSSTSHNFLHENSSTALFNDSQESDMAKDGGTRVIVPTEILMRRVEFCKLSIIGRVILAKGEEAWPTIKLRERLNDVWKFNSSWRLISLGKGFFHVLLTSQEEYEKVWMRGTINLKPGVIRWQKWVFGFDPLKEKSSNAQVWFRFYNLPWCLWDNSILTALSRKIGTPIRFDNNTVNGDFGHYARVLIDVDLSKNIKTNLQLDCGKDIFDVKVVPENIPQFCKACSNIGHNSSECRSIKRMVDNSKATVESKEMSGKHVESTKTRQAVVAIENRVETHRKQRMDKRVSFEDMVPDIGNQALSVQGQQGSRDILSTNKFAALEEQHDKEREKENESIQNGVIPEVNDVEEEQRISQSKTPVDHTLKEIRKWAEQEKRNMMQSTDDTGLMGAPTVPKRWSDMIEEEEKEKDCAATPSSSAPKKRDILYYERHGERAEVQISTGIVRFSPIPNKEKRLML